MQLLTEMRILIQLIPTNCVTVGFVTLAAWHFTRRSCNNLWLGLLSLTIYNLQKQKLEQKLITTCSGLLFLEVLEDLERWQLGAVSSVVTQWVNGSKVESPHWNCVVSNWNCLQHRIYQTIGCENSALDG